MTLPKNRGGRPLRGRLTLEPLEDRRLLAALLNLNFATNGLAADTAPGPSIRPGDAVAWTYDVTNTGNQALTGLSVSDDAGTPAVAADDLIASPVLAPAAARGTLEKTLNLSAARFLAHPTLPYVYASVPTAQSVAVIHTVTLEQVALVNVGSVSGGMALSADGARLYIAGSSKVLDTQTNTAVDSFLINGSDVEVGAGGVLYVLASDAIHAINAQTGQVAGPSIMSRSVYGGELAISPSRDRLYYADYGLSPASLYQFDLTVSPPRLLWESPHGGTSGSNGQDLAISSDGSFVSYACGSGQGGYVIAKYRTSDMAIVGTFNTGAYPREITFSPDGAVAYTVNTSGAIGTWDTSTFLALGAINISGEATELQVDASGSRLFAAVGSQVRVYATGRGGSTNAGDANRNGVFDPGETWRFQAGGVAQAGQQTRTATATAKDPLNNSVTDSDLSHYFGPTSVIRVEGAVNGQDADQPAGATVRAGAAIQLTYALTASGPGPLAEVVLVDDAGTPNDPADDLRPGYVSGDADNDQLLDAGETWNFVAATTAQAGQRTHRATATASPVDAQNQPIPAVRTSASDPTNYFGAVASLEVTSAVNGSAANTAPGARQTPGAPLEFNYQVKNTGNTPLAGVALVDSGPTPNASDDFSPAPVLAPRPVLGALEKTYDLKVSRFVQDPNAPYLYVSVYSTNSVAVINTNTLQQEALIFVGSGPQGMALSLDGSRLYVANGSSNALAVVDTQSRTLLTSFTLPERPHDVEVGADGRLYVLGDDSLMQISPLTGQAVGPNIGSSHMVYSGELAISPSKDRLYYADYGLSPASLYQLDLTVNPPQLLWESPHGGTSGSNGQDLAISSDGSFVSYACGAGQGGYVIAKYRTSDMSILGTFNTGAYPREVTFSADNKIAYTVNTSGRIDRWDTTTFLSLGPIPTSGEAYELAADASGNHVFAAFDTELRVYSTGKSTADFNLGDVNRNQLLDPGETWTYRAAAAAISGNYAAVATASATDSLAAAVSAAVTTYYVGFVNQPPAGGPDSYSTDEDSPLAITAAAGVLANDSDPNGDALTLALIAQPAHGMLQLRPDGSFTYTPAANYHGPDRFTYRLSDGALTSSLVTVAIDVAPVNDRPVAAGETYSLFADSTYTVASPGILGNDTDADGDSLTAELVASPLHGVVRLQADGGFSFQPHTGFTGSTSFSYVAKDAATSSDPVTVTLNVRPANNPPDARNDHFAGLEDQPLEIPLSAILANDTDADGQSLEVLLAAMGPAHGTLALRAGQQTLLYTPDPDFFGDDVITYYATDGQAISAPTSIRIQVAPVNDAPRFTPGGNIEVSDESGAQTFAWASHVAAGPSNEASQKLQFLVTASNLALFTAAPAIDAAGKLTFTPAPNLQGTATVLVALLDDGGTAAGGENASPPATFQIVIHKPHALHNAANALDVTANGHVSAEDVLAVINHLNAGFPQQVSPAAGRPGEGEGQTSAVRYLDVTRDNWITALDALAIINHINAGLAADPPAGEPAAPAAEPAGESATELDLLALLAADIALAGKQKR